MSSEFEDEFPNDHHHQPEFRNEYGVFGADVFARDNEGRHYHLQARLTDEGLLLDVWDRYGEQILATFARTYDELVDFVFTIDPMNDPWMDDGVQFLRLLAEIAATQETLDIEALAKEMDLGVVDVSELLDRAQVRWEFIKRRK